MERRCLPSKNVYYNWSVKSFINHNLAILYSKRCLMKLNNNELYSLNSNILFINDVFSYGRYRNQTKSIIIGLILLKLIKTILY